ncbi:MAG: PEP-CTERM sorting domain-containing protein [Xanthobacteraceae bacterium]
MDVRVLVCGVALVSAFAVGGIGAAQANLLTNGSFETGDLTGWTQSGGTSETIVTNQIYAGSTGAEQGAYYVHEGEFNTDPGMLSQTFSDAVGQTLLVSGWVIDNGNGGPANVQFIFDGTTEENINMTAPPTGNSPSPDVWTEYSFDVTATGSDTFALSYFDNPSCDGLDNFSVTAEVSSTPLPATLPLFAGGLGLMGFLGLRQKRKASAAA